MQIIKQSGHDAWFYQYQCYKCKRGILTKDALDAHMIDHTKPKQIPKQSKKRRESIQKCNVKKVKEIKAEKKETSTQPQSMLKPVFYPYKCIHCARGLPTKESQEDHMNTHIKDIPCQDPSGVCMETFYSKEVLWSHMLSAHSFKYEPGIKMKVKCDQCNYRSTKYQVKHHQSKHSKGKNFVCPQCGKHLKTEECLKAHMMRHAHVGGVHGCTTCGKTFFSKGYLNTHMKQSHITQRVVCSECGKDFPGKGALNVHMNIHTDEKNFHCRESCQKTFGHPSSRRKHERSCRGVKEFKCKLCPKEFMQSVSLKFHMGNHGGEKDKKCKTCGEAYIDPRRARQCKHQTIRINQ